ncbi:MAG: hypothetical protein QXU91_02860 [Thermofilum sp.]
MRLLLAVAAVLVIALLLTPVTAEVAPTLRVDYVEVLELKEGTWSSRYLQLTSPTIRLQTSAEVLIVRTDPSSGIAPVRVLVDGGTPPFKVGSGFLWNSLILQLDGRFHDVLVTFGDAPQAQPSAHVVAVYKGEARPGENLTVPGMPGLTPAGFSLTVLVSDLKSLPAIVESGFLLNLSEVSLMGEKIFAAVLLVPRTTLSLGGGFLKCSYSYLYFAPRTYATAALLSGALTLTFANHPSLKALNSSLLPGKPPHLALLAGIEDVSVAEYNVTLDVKLPEDLCGSRVTYRLISPGEAGAAGYRVGLRDNTTIVLRFYKSGLAAADVVVTTPPPSLRLAAPLYSLDVEFRDQMGNLIPSGSLVLTRQGKVVGTAQVVNGSSNICGLPPGEYIALVYRWGALIAKHNLQIAGDTFIALATNTTTLEVQVFRQGVGELLTNYTVLLRGAGFAEHAQAAEKARIAGVPPGNYTLEISKSGVPLAAVNLSVSWGASSFSLTLPVYRLRVKILDALDRPLEDAAVVLKGVGFTVNSSVSQTGVIDFGYLPSGEYTLLVEYRRYVHVERLVLAGDSVKTVRTAVVTVLGGFVVTLEHVQLLGLALLLLFSAALLRSVIKRVVEKRKKIVEV